MSAKGLRNFTVHNKPGETDKLVQRLKDGLTSNKYKHVDYDKLKALAAEKKSAGNEKLLKVKKLQEVSKQGKEQHLQKQHRMVWHREFLRLNTLRRKMQTEIEFHIRLNTDSELADYIYYDFDEHESSLDRDFMTFKKATVDPIWTLRDDLQYWITQHKGSLDPAVQEDGEQVMETVESVKKQQKKILAKLDNEQASIENELRAGELMDMFGPHDRKPPQTGIPTEAFDLECPDLTLKASVLEEFILLDEKYLERLEALETDHAAALQSSTGGWSEDDHYLYQIIVDQYPHDLQNRRTLYIDRLRRHLPKKTRARIVEHEDWWTRYRFYMERRKDLISDWLRDRRELLNRGKVIFAEACVAHELNEVREENRLKQQEICAHLYDKVKTWREQKLEAMKLQEEIESRRQAQRLQNLQAEEDKEKQRRASDKDKIKARQEELEAVRYAQEEKDQKRLEELKAHLAEQAAYDRQRVKYRDEQFLKKKEEQHLEEKMRQEKEEEKERRLESLRERVRPHVEEDLVRLWSDTKAWEAKLKPSEDDILLQKPLFEVNTFTSKQITTDPRIRLEAKLRDAGVLNTAYARQVISEMKPAQMPRRDMASTVFKNN